jgi:hypothetical protein
MLFKISDDIYNIIDIFTLPDEQIYYNDYWKSVNKMMKLRNQIIIGIVMTKEKVEHK